jgi:hypothetical protein
MGRQRQSFRRERVSGLDKRGGDSIDRGHTKLEEGCCEEETGEAGLERGFSLSKERNSDEKRWI